MKLGIIGLPQAGKTTVFNALTHGNQPVGQMASGGRFALQQAVVNVPDPRVDWLAQRYNPRKTVYAQVNYVDIAGLEGGGGAFSGALLNALAQLDGYLLVVREFEDERVPHPFGAIDAPRDIAALDGELLLNDLLAVERKLERLQDERGKGGGRDRAEIDAETELFERVQVGLNDGTPLRAMDLADDEMRLLSGYNLLSGKPRLIVLNADETQLAAQLDRTGLSADDHIVRVLGKIEMEIAQLAADEAAEFLQEYGLDEPSLDRMIRRSYDLLRLHSFFTVGEDEVRAWTVRAGTTAPRAAAAIHSDMESGFIRAEVMAYHDLHAHGSEAAVKAAGKWRLEGKNYVVADGDILSIRFSPPAKK